MKTKNLKALLTLIPLMVCIMLLVLSGCEKEPHTPTPDELRAQLEAEQSVAIKEAYINDVLKDSDIKKEDITIRFCKITSKYAAVFIDGGEKYTENATLETVSTFDFKYPTAQPLTVYVGGKLTTVTDAYSSGAITDGDLLDIYVAYFTSNKAIYRDTYWEPETVIDHEIRVAYYENHRESIKDYSIYTISIKHITNYKETYFVRISCICCYEIYMHSSFNTDAYSFFDYGGKGISVYKNGSLYSLEDAYENGIITDEEFTHIYETVKIQSPLTFEYMDYDRYIDELIENYEIKVLQNSDAGINRHNIRFCGSYDGAIVFFAVACAVYEPICSEETLGNYTFLHSTEQRLTVYKDGEFSTLEQAYTNGIIPEEYLERVSELCNENDYFPSCLFDAVTAKYNSYVRDAAPFDKAELTVLLNKDNIYVFEIYPEEISSEGTVTESIGEFDFTRADISSLVFLDNTTGVFCYLSEAYQNNLISNEFLEMAYNNFSQN